MNTENQIYLKNIYNIILEREQNFSLSVGTQVIERPSVSFWMILFPILYIIHFVNLRKYREGVNLFAKNFLENKKIALDAAFQSLIKDEEKNISINSVLENINSKINEINTQLKTKILIEINILYDHYIKLLKSTGESYEDLIKNSYITELEYREFIKRLNIAEQEVYDQVLILSNSNECFKNTISKIKYIVSNLREEEIKKLF